MRSKGVDRVIFYSKHFSSTKLFFVCYVTIFWYLLGLAVLNEISWIIFDGAELRPRTKRKVENTPTRRIRMPGTKNELTDINTNSSR